MPMFTMSVIGSPVAPRQWRPWISAQKRRIFSSSACTAGITSLPAVEDRPLAGRMAQRDVQRGATFGVVDRLAAAHACDPARQICRLPQRAQQRHGIGINALLGVIQQPVVPGYRVRGEAISIGGEHVAQMTPLQALGSGA
jgi:hypothetical protein